MTTLENVTLSPAQKVAALSALKEGLSQLIDDEKAAVLRFAAEHGIKSFATSIGTVTIVEKQQDLIINKSALIEKLQADKPELLDRTVTVTAEGIAWLQANHPEFVTETVDVSLNMAEAIKKSLTVVDGDVYDVEGSVASYATLGASPKAYVALPASNSKTAAIEYAKSILALNIDSLATPVLEA